MLASSTYFCERSCAGAEGGQTSVCWKAHLSNKDPSEHHALSAALGITKTTVKGTPNL